MDIGGLDTQRAAAQLQQLFGIEEIFKRRGRTVAKYEPIDQLLFNCPPHEFPEPQYHAMHSTTFRRVIAAVANATEPCGCSQIGGLGITEAQTRQYLDQAVELGMLCRLGDRYAPAREVTFGATLEWYVASICVNELASIAYWGVSMESLTGDYDVVTVRDTQVGYIECKSGRFSNIYEADVAKFLERERLLAPQFSVFLADGISSQNVETLVGYAVEQSHEYELELPGIMWHEGRLEVERYSEFSRIIPINAFFLSVQQRPLAESLRTIYRFLTLVCDRSVRVENRAAKRLFENDSVTEG